MTSYDGLSALVDTACLEAAYAELRIYGIQPGEDGSLQNQGGGGLGSSGPYPAGPDDVIPNYVPQDDDSPGNDGSPVSIGQIISKWDGRVRPVFDPFFGFAEPADFQELADEVRMALMKISAQSGSGSRDSSADTEGIAYPGNEGLGDIDQVAQQLNAWQGTASEAFARYLNVFEGVLANQAAAADVLRATLIIEKEMWTRLRSDVVTLATQSIEAFKACGRWGADDLKAAIDVASTIADVVGWFPPAAPIAEGADKALTVAGFIVDSMGTPPEDPPLGAWEPDGVLSKMESAAEKITTASQTVEGDIRTTLVNLSTEIKGAPDAAPQGPRHHSSYHMARPSSVYNADSADDFVDGAGTPQVQANWENVRTQANRLDQDLAPTLDAGANHLNNADSASAWGRSDGSIGIGTWGAYSEYSDASYALQKEIEQSANEFRWAAEMLRAVVDFLKGTDDNVNDNFNAVRTDIENYDAPPPVPTPTRRPYDPSGTYGY